MKFIKKSSLRAVAAFSTVIAMVFIACVFVSCDNNVDSMISPIEESITVLNSNSIGVSMKASNNDNYVGIDESILAYFTHYCQRKAGSDSGSPYYGEGYIDVEIARSACCPTSYMMAAACLAHSKDGYSTSYKANGGKLASLISGFGNNYRYLYVARNYCNNNDNSFLKADTMATRDRNSAKIRMENALLNNKFVIVNINAYIYNYNTVNKSSLFSKSTSINEDLSFGTSQYITELKTKTDIIGGHVILILSIEKWETGNGIVTYIDPLAVTRSGSNRRYVLYSRLLDSMKQSSSSGNVYNALFVGLK